MAQLLHILTVDRAFAHCARGGLAFRRRAVLHRRGRRREAPRRQARWRDQKAALEKEKIALAGAANEGVRLAHVRDARNRWIRVVSALEGALEISGAEEAVVNDLLMPLREAESKADAKVDRRRTIEPVSPAPAKPSSGEKPPEGG